jgi:hypothetical protein
VHVTVLPVAEQPAGNAAADPVSASAHNADNPAATANDTANEDDRRRINRMRPS